MPLADLIRLRTCSQLHIERKSRLHHYTKQMYQRWHNRACTRTRLVVLYPLHKMNLCYTTRSRKLPAIPRTR